MIVVVGVTVIVVGERRATVVIVVGGGATDVLAGLGARFAAGVVARVVVGGEVEVEDASLPAVGFGLPVAAPSAIKATKIPTAHQRFLRYQGRLPSVI